MISREIEFVAPNNLAEALEVLERRAGEVTVLSGGMSLVPMMNLGLAAPDVVMALTRVDELAALTEERDELVIGAMVRHVQIATDPLVLRDCPSLAEAASRIGDVQVRNRGTIGGSTCHADPAADYLPVLAAHGARFVLQSAAGERVLDAKDFFVHVMLTAREPNELLTAIRVPKLPVGWGSAYVRFARVEGSFAIVNAAAVVAADRSRATLALGGVAHTPVVLDISEHGRDGWDEAAIAAVGNAAFEASSEATGDINSDAEYRREMARVHARRVMRAAVDSLAAVA